MSDVTGREELRAFCTKYAKDEHLVLRAFERLGPFFKIAENGPYPLRPEEEFDRKVMASAIGGAVLRPVTDVRFISVAKAIDDAERESGTRERNGLWYAFERMLWDALWARNNVTMWGPLKRPVSHGSRQQVGNVLWDIMERSLCLPLADRVTQTLKAAGFGQHLCESVPKNLTQALFYFVGFAVGGSADRVGEMEPLMENLPGCVPIGEMRRKDEEPASKTIEPGSRRKQPTLAKDDGNGEWLVLVA